MTDCVHFYYYTDLPQEAVPVQMLDFINIIENGAKKYELNGWLGAEGARCSEKEMHDSMFHHLAESFVMEKHCRPHPMDTESGLDPLLHLACRALMLYTRRQLGIIHPNDKEK